MHCTTFKTLNGTLRSFTHLQQKYVTTQTSSCIYTWATAGEVCTFANRDLEFTGHRTEITAIETVLSSIHRHSACLFGDVAPATRYDCCSSSQPKTGKGQVAAPGDIDWIRPQWKNALVSKHGTQQSMASGRSTLLVAMLKPESECYSVHVL